MDPFGDTSDPRLYVPLLATEAALASLRTGFAAGTRLSLLVGPPGLGKTAVLHAFARELRSARCAYVPYPALEADELAALILEQLGTPAPVSRPFETFAALARDGQAPLVLLIDDATALPVTTARKLRQLVDADRSALRLVCAFLPDPRADAVVAALGAGALRVHLRHALSPREVHRYVRGRLARAKRPDLSRRLRDAQIDRIAEESAGIPRRVNQLVSELLRRRPIPRSLIPGPEARDDRRGAPPSAGAQLKPPATGPASASDRRPRKRSRLGRYGLRFSRPRRGW